MATRTALLLTVGLAGLILIASIAVGQEKRAAAHDSRGDLTLFAAPYAILQGNEFQCNIVNSGDTCAKVFNTPLGGGGFWPRGTPNQYIFNTGIQIAGIVGPDGGPWAGDTTGAFFFDPRGTQYSGTSLTNVHDATNPDDLADWPAEARVADDDLFRSSDIGRAAISEQDSWTRYWEGDPLRLSGRPHPLGIEVTQRSLQWSYPSGAESVIYFILDIANVSANDDFRSLNEAEFFAGDDILPNEGYTLTEVYVALAADMDVTTSASENFSTAILPLDLSVSYHGGFDAPSFIYPPELHYPPFFVRAPGIVGTKFLETPRGPDGTDVGVSFWTETSHFSFGGLRDPVGAEELWRYLSGNIDPPPGEPTCNIAPEIAGPTPAASQQSACWTSDETHDSRYTMATGPFELPAGDTQTLAIAYVVAPALETLPDGTPTGIFANSSDPNANPPGVPSFHPGFPSARGCTDETAVDCTDVDATNAVRPIERAAGWMSYDGPAPSGALESAGQKLNQFAVETATHSLLDRALVAQLIFDAKFLHPTPPEPPTFYLLPGPNEVTVVFEPSATDEVGDPYFELASDPSSPLYNPNYRQFDVQAYEIWRGVSADDLELLAVFEYFDRPFVDTTCELVRPGEEIGNPAGPGYTIGEACPDGYERTEAFVRFFNNGVPGGRPGRGVVRAATGGAGVVDSLGVFPLPEWEGVRRFDGTQFLYRDTSLVNNFAYFYAVTAVDLNSPASGPPTQRSARDVRSAVPRAEAPNLTEGHLTMEIEEGSGNPLRTDGDIPEIDPEDGTFDGPFPPTRGIEQSFAPLVEQLLPVVDLAVRIDSVKPDWQQQEGCTAGPISFESTCWRMYLTSNDGQQSEIAGLASNWRLFARPALATTETTARVARIAYDERALDAFGIPSLDANAVVTFVLDESINFSNWEGQQNRRDGFGRTIHGGVRWFSGDGETVADPARYIRIGHLSGVDSVWAPIHHTPRGPGEPELPNSAAVQWFGYMLAHLGRSADFEVRWNDGTITVHDVTHGVEVPFSGDYGSSWGFLDDDCDGSGAVDWIDFFCVGEGRPFWEDLAFNGTVSLPPASLSDRPSVGPIGLDTNLPQGPTHTGIALYLNGMRHFFAIDQLPADGTVWTLRAYHGVVRTDVGQNAVEDPGGYRWRRFFDQADGIASPLIPGLTLRWRASSPALGLTGPADLAAIHTVPDPYLLYSAYDGGGTDKELLFVNLPPRATVRIYSLGGILVDVVDHDDPTGGGRAPWDLRNRGGQFVASGVYFWHVVTPGGEERVGKFTIVNPHRD